MNEWKNNLVYKMIYTSNKVLAMGDSSKSKI